MVINAFLLLVPGQRHTDLGVHVKTLLKECVYVFLFELCFWHPVMILILTLVYKKFFDDDRK